MEYGSIKLEYIKLGRSGSIISVIGQGCSTFGYHEEKEIETIRFGLDLGINLIDTAEVYSDGLSERVIGKAIKHRRHEAFISTKISSANLSYDKLLKSAKRSLKRLGIDIIDLYQIHFPNPAIPIKETMQAMERLVKEGYIRHIGVSNFSIAELKEAQAAMVNEKIVSIQVPYSLLQRHIEVELLPYCQKEQIVIIVASPLAAGNILMNQNLVDMAAHYGKSVSQVALNWTISKPGVVVIPRTKNLEHIKENCAACGWRLSSIDIDALNSTFNKYIQSQVPTRSIRNSIMKFVSQYLPGPLRHIIRKYYIYR